MKYIVHQYVVVRVPVEVEAESVQAAIAAADEQFEASDIDDGEYAEEVTGYTVDPLLPDGEVDYENTVSCEFEGGVLHINGEPVEE